MTCCGPACEVITPSPLSSGSAKWNLLAPYAVKSKGGQNGQAGIDFVRKLVSEHVKLRPGSGREATDVFVQGSGDVLISYENEAIATERAGKPVEHVIPPQTFKIENPLAVVATSPHLAAAIAFKNFQYTAAAQKVWAQAGFRPVDPAVAAEFRDQYPRAGETVDHRRPRWLGHGGSATVRQDHRQHHQDLHAGHRMTADGDPRPRGDPAGTRR